MDSLAVNWFAVFAGLFILVVIFLLLREFWCWYWKINKIAGLQKETNELLKELIAKDVGRGGSLVSGDETSSYEYEKTMD